MSYKTWSEVPEILRGDDSGSNVGESSQTEPTSCRLFESMFPPAEREKVGCIELQETIRLLPAHNGSCDHGGFYVAFFERVTSSPSRKAQVQACFKDGLVKKAPDTIGWAPSPYTLRSISEFFGLDNDGGRGYATDSSDRLLASLIVTSRHPIAEDRTVGDSEEEIILSAVSAGISNLLTGSSTCVGNDLPAYLECSAAGHCWIGGGAPIFARMPSHCSWWPCDAPYAVLIPATHLQTLPLTCLV